VCNATAADRLTAVSTPKGCFARDKRHASPSGDDVANRRRPSKGGGRLDFALIKNGDQDGQ